MLGLLVAGLVWAALNRWAVQAKTPSFLSHQHTFVWYPLSREAALIFFFRSAFYYYFGPYILLQRVLLRKC